MPKLFIIADDLTGAIDTGVQVAKHAVPTVVIPDLMDRPEISSFDTVVVNTESRHCSADCAASAVSSAVEFGSTQGTLFYYKKTDSSLRGNLGSEFNALMQATGNRKLMFIPAYPKMHRTTREGKQYVKGVAVHESEFARDPLNPLRTADIASLIRRQVDVPTHTIRISQLPNLKTEDDGIYIFDCDSDADMPSLADALRRTGCVKLLAGSAGFADYLPSLLDLTTAVELNDEPDAATPMLIVNGSLNSVSQKQVSIAAQRGFTLIVVDPENLLAVDGQEPLLFGNIMRQLEAGFRAGTPVVISLGCEQNQFISTDPHPHRHSLELANRLGKLIAKLVCRSGCRTLTVFGGDTLSAIARALHGNRIIPIEELLPGIPISKLDSSDKEFFIVSKAGGFGPDDVLPKVQARIRRTQQ